MGLGFSSPFLVRRVFRRGRGRARDGQRGAALVQVLLLVTVMSAIAVAMSEDLLFAAKRGQNVRAAEQAVWYALGGEELAAPLISQALEADPNLTMLTEPFSQVFPLEGGFIEIHVRDGANCFNVNTLLPRAHGGQEDGAGGDGVSGEDVLTNDGTGDDGVSDAGAPLSAEERAEVSKRALGLLLLDIGVPRGDARRIVGGVTDWIDADGLPTQGGAETFDYSLLEPAYRASNQPMVDLSELRAVAGVDQALYLGMRPFLCARAPDLPTPLNVNTLQAGQAVLLHAALDGQISVEDARSVLEQRPAAGFADTDAVWDTGALADLDRTAFPRSFGVTSSLFEVTIFVVYQSAYVELRSTLKVESVSGEVKLIQRRFGAVS